MRQKYLIRHSGLSLEQGDRLVQAAQAIDPSGLSGMLVSFVTYDSSAKSYDPHNPKTWTTDIWLGNFELLIASEDVIDTRKLDNLKQAFWIETGELRAEAEKSLSAELDRTDYAKIKSGQEIREEKLASASISVK